MQTVHTTSPTTSVLDAMKLMAEKGIGALVVIEAGKSSASSPSATTRARPRSRSERGTTTLVRDIMTAVVIHVHPDQTSEDCIALMAKNKLRHLPVMDGDALVGMISIRDLVGRIIAAL